MGTHQSGSTWIFFNFFTFFIFFCFCAENGVEPTKRGLGGRVELVSRREASSQRKKTGKSGRQSGAANASWSIIEGGAGRGRGSSIFVSSVDAKEKDATSSGRGIAKIRSENSAI